MHAAPKIAQPELVPTYFDPPDQYKTIVLYWFGHLCPEPVSNRPIPVVILVQLCLMLCGAQLTAVSWRHPAEEVLVQLRPAIAQLQNRP